MYYFLVVMRIKCKLCPKGCVISAGESGECRIRINIDGKLKAVTYGFPVAVHMDPIEKKPLFHFLPGSDILSIATAGCNLHCKNCQNWEISQANPEDVNAYFLPPEKLVKTAIKSGSSSIAYTYTEPLVYYEYTLDSSILAHENGLRNVLVTAGYLNREPLRKLYSYTDGANIDLKAFSDSFYREICGGTLLPVLDSLILAKKMGVWVEVTNLVIPTLNDSEQMIRKLSKWVKENLGPETPLHFSRFYPRYKLTNLPPTPSSTLERARQIAMGEGLYYVYIGNLYTREGENTYCPQCGRVLIKRKGFSVLENNLISGKCKFCDRKVEGVW